MIKKTGVLVLLTLSIWNHAFSSTFLSPPPAPPQVGRCNCAQQFGADPTGTADSTVANNACVQYALANKLNPYWPGGNYLTGPIFCFLYTGSGASVTMTGVTTAKFIGDENMNGTPGTQFTMNSSSKGDPTFVVQGCHECQFDNLFGIGQMTGQNIVEGSAYLYNGPASFATANGVTGFQTNPVSPHCFIAVDPAKGAGATNIAGDPGYTDAAVSWIYNLQNIWYSYDIQFINCGFRQYPVGFALLGGGGYSQEGDHMSFWTPRSDTFNGICIENIDDQADDVEIYRDFLGSAWCTYDAGMVASLATTFAVSGGTASSWYGGEATATKYHYMLSGFNNAVSHFQDLYFEGCLGFGEIFTPSPALFDNVTFQFQQASNGGSSPPLDYVANFEGPTIFNGGLIGYSSGNASTNPIRFLMGQANGTSKGAHITFNSVQMPSIANAANPDAYAFYSNTSGNPWTGQSFFSNNDSNVVLGSNDYALLETQTQNNGWPVRMNMQPGQTFTNTADGYTYTNNVDGQINLHNAYAITYSATKGEGTFNLVAADKNKLESGDTLGNNTTTYNITNGGDMPAVNNCRGIMGEVFSIDGTGVTVSLGGLSSSVSTANPNVFTIYYTPIGHPFTYGAFSAGSSVVTAISVTLNGSGAAVTTSPANFWKVGNRVTVPGAGVSTGTYIFGISGTSVTLSTPAQTTVNSEMYDADMIPSGQFNVPGGNIPAFGNGTVTATTTTPVTVVTYIPAVTNGYVLKTWVKTPGGAPATYPSFAVTDGQFIMTSAATDTSTYYWGYSKQ